MVERERDESKSESESVLELIESESNSGFPAGSDKVDCLGSKDVSAIRF